MPNYVLVYGTLRPGCHAYDWFNLNEHTNHVGQVTVPGSMYNLGSYPGVKLDGNPDGVVCDVLEVINPDIIGRLDTYEGYNPDFPTSSLYVRQEITVADLPGPAFIYEYNMDVGGRSRMEIGDWTKRN